MRRLTRLSDSFPTDTKYVLEVCGPLVRRYLEFPDGHIVELEPRKALTCRCQALIELEAKKSTKAAA
jgi:hypothetical protein